MNKTSSNIYKNARLKAELRREPVAEELHIDVRTLDKYESLDGRVPPDEIVKKMCELYNNNYLAYLHIKQSPLGEFFPDLHPATFESATLTMVSSLNDVNGIVNQIIKIASDGKVNDWEKADWEKCCKEITHLASAIFSINFANKEG